MVIEYFVKKKDPLLSKWFLIFKGLLKLVKFILKKHSQVLICVE